MTATDAGPGAARIGAAFDRARAQDRAALITYLTACYPDPATSRACFASAVAAGADILEIGMPFSDPMMDGPVIQAANQHVLDAGISIAEQFEFIASLRDLEVPKLVMTYVTIADTRGYARFAAACVEAGVAGVILPDLPVPEADDWLAEAEPRGLATVFLASSVSTDERLDAIAARSAGWVYATGLLGVTGVKAVSTEPTRHLVQRLRARTRTPIAVGIGVKDRRSAAEVATYADGVIVGSSIVRAVADGDPDAARGRVADLVRDLRAGVADRI